MVDADATYVHPTPVATKAAGEMPSVPGYEVQQLLGQGGMGKVYQARHQKLKRIVALKLVSEVNNEQVLARFEEEVQAIASLRHTNIAQIYESGQVDGRPFYAMEFVEGGPLSDRLKTGPLLPRQAAELLVLLAKAMQHAHEQNILHRDLKPSNILLSAQCSVLCAQRNAEKGPSTEHLALSTLTPKIADFGLAKRLSDDSKITRTGEIFGSPSYMAPEQASGVMKLTAAVDVYALGAILYECLTGRPPFLGPDPMQTVMMALSNDPLPPKQLQPKLPQDLNTICMKCLEKLPKKRYASAQALAEDLERYLKGEPIQARPVGALERVQKWAVRRPWQAVAAGLSLFLVIGLIAGVVILERAYRQTRDANHVANQAYELSRNTLSDTMRINTDKIATLPNSEALVIESFGPALKMYRKLDSLRPEDKQTTLDYAQLLYEYVLLQVMYYRYDEAEQTFQETERLLNSKLGKRPNDFEFQLYRAKLLFNRGWLARRQNKLNDALSIEGQAKSLIAALDLQQPQDPRLLQLSNEVLQTNIKDALTDQRWDDALLYHRLILANHIKLYESSPTNEQAIGVMSAQKSLATFLLVGKNYQESETLFQTIDLTLPKLKLTTRDRVNISTEVAIARGDIARRRKDWPLAESLLNTARESNRQLRTQYPLDANYLYQELDIRCKQAELIHDQGHVEKASQNLKQCVADAEKIVKEHPEYTSIASQLNYYRGILQKYQAETQKP